MKTQALLMIGMMVGGGLSLAGCQLFREVEPAQTCTEGALGCACVGGVVCLGELECVQGICAPEREADMSADMPPQDMPSGDMAPGDMARLDMTSGDMSPDMAPDMMSTDMGGLGPRYPVALAAGGAHTCAVIEGRPWCWGANTGGQLGLRADAMSAAPMPVNLGNVAEISAGTEHTCAIMQDGRMVCWGANDRGQLGAGSVSGGEVPQPVNFPDGTKIAWSSGSHNTTCAVDRKFRVWCWGEGFHGQLGTGVREQKSEPVRASYGDAVWDLRAGRDHSCLVGLTTQEVWCWGENNKGQVGVTPDPALEYDIPFPTQASSRSGFAEVAVGRAHTCALMVEPSRGMAGVDLRTVWCWGANNNGQLGQAPGTLSEGFSSAGYLVNGLQEPLMLAAGGDFTCALEASGEVWCWGDGSDGQLGQGVAASSHVPVKVRNVSSAIHIVAGHGHVCAADTLNEVWCWGDNRGGQIGNTDYLQTATPVPVVFRAPGGM